MNKLMNIGDNDNDRYRTPILTGVLNPAMDLLGKDYVVEAMADQASHLSRATGCEVSFHSLVDSNCGVFSKYGESWFRISKPKLFSGPGPRIMDLKDIPEFFNSRLDGDIRVYASHDATEYYRGKLFQRACRFIIEQNPYRYEVDGIDPVPMYDRVLTDYGIKIGPISQAWLSAPIELIIGYGLGGIQAVGYERPGLTPDP